MIFMKENLFPLKFRGAVLEETNKPLKIKDVIFEGPLEVGQVLVKIEYSGICGKQIEEVTGTMGKDIYLPHMLGHEASGFVVSTGPGVKKVSKGDNVILHWMKGSGINSNTPKYHDIQGNVINAGWITTFNEYAVVSENRVTKISFNFDKRLGCLFGCAATTGIGLIVNDVNLKLGESIAIFGCGGVGLISLQTAKSIGSYPIIAVDINNMSLKLAQKFGATYVLNSKDDDFFDKFMRLTNGQGVMHSVVTTGNIAAIELAIKCASIPGNVYFCGVPPKDSIIKISPLDIHRQKVLRGSVGGGIFPDVDIPKYLNFCNIHENKIDLLNLINYEVMLDNINDGISKVIQGGVGRCIVRFKE